MRKLSEPSRVMTTTFIVRFMMSVCVDGMVKAHDVFSRSH